MPIMGYKLLFITLLGLCAADTVPSDSPPTRDQAERWKIFREVSANPELHPDFRDAFCLECKTAAAILDGMLVAGASVEEIEDFTIAECINFDLFPDKVCSGMVRLAGGEVLYVLNNTDYNFDTICGWILGHCKSTDLKSWTLEIPGGKPEPVHPEPEQPTAGVIRVLHLSDLHADLLYDEGSAAYCEYPRCCRHEFGDPAEGEEAAGHWGTLSECDIPLHTLDDLLAQAAIIAKPDLVYVTGDIPAHDVWAQSHESNLFSINTTMGLLRKHFPGIPVINTIGNHASAPVNSFVVPAAYDAGWSMSWLYDGVAEMWSPWLPAEETGKDVRRGGFYSFSPFPGFRVVALNMEYCNTLNWWLLLDNTDPTDELQWLIDTLAAAEAAGEKVHLMGHTPPGSGCDDSWSHVFNLICTRYESTIRGMFYGHKHSDSWEILYDPEGNYTRPVGAVFIVAAGTTGSTHNPSFTIYTIDGGHEDATWTVLDSEVYNMNMTLANAEGGYPVYTRRYSSQESYGISSMTPASLDRLLFNMASDPDLFRNFIRNKYSYWDEPSEMWTCDKSCRRRSLCGMVTSDATNREPCHRIEAAVDASDN